MQKLHPTLEYYWVRNTEIPHLGTSPIIAVVSVIASETLVAILVVFATALWKPGGLLLSHKLHHKQIVN